MKKKNFLDCLDFELETNFQVVFNSLPSSDKSNPKALRSAAAKVVLPASPPNSQIRQRHSHIVDIFLCLQFGHQTTIFFPDF